MSDMRFEADPFGELRIWRNPEPGQSYVIGVDTAEGISDDMRKGKAGDFSSGFVINGHTLEHHASWHGHVDPYPFAEEMALLGQLYNGALLVPERNNHGLTVINRLVHELEYPNIYQQTFEADKDAGRSKPETKYGFLTTGSQGWNGTKAMAVDMLRAVVRRITPIHDHRFYAEALTWVLNEKGKPVTNEGANDDTLMAAAMAYYAAHEVYGTAFLTKKPVVATASDRRIQKKQETWRNLLARHDEVCASATQADIPVEISQFYD